MTMNVSSLPTPFSPYSIPSWHAQFPYHALTLLILVQISCLTYFNSSIIAI